MVQKNNNKRSLMKSRLEKLLKQSKNSKIPKEKKRELIKDMIKLIEEKIDHLEDELKRLEKLYEEDV